MGAAHNLFFGVLLPRSILMQGQQRTLRMDSQPLGREVLRKGSGVPDTCLSTTLPQGSTGLSRSAVGQETTCVCAQSSQR